MQKLTIVAVASMLTAVPAFADNPAAAIGAATHPAKPATVGPAPGSAKAGRARLDAGIALRRRARADA